MTSDTEVKGAEIYDCHWKLDTVKYQSLTKSYLHPALSRNGIHLKKKNTTNHPASLTPTPTPKAGMTHSTWQPWLISLHRRRQPPTHNCTPKLEKLSPEKLQDLKHIASHGFAEPMRRLSFTPEQPSLRWLPRSDWSVMWSTAPEADSGYKYSKTEPRTKSSVRHTTNTYRGGYFF